MARTGTILLTNDDGIRSDGLLAVETALKAAGHAVWVVAPETEMSGSGHSLSLDKPLRAVPAGEWRFAINGTPTDCVYIALAHLLPVEPDLVVSGINHGANLGCDLTYSGTVCAAMEAAIHGLPGLALSLVVAGPRNFGGAARASLRLVDGLLAGALRPRTFLNVNFPDRPGEYGQFRVTFQGRRRYGREVIEREDPRNRTYLWIGGDISRFEDLPGSDCNTVQEGIVSVTPVQLDLTDHSQLERLAIPGVTSPADRPDAPGSVRPD